MDHINKLSEIGIPPIPAMIRVFAFKICQKRPRNHWVDRFIKIHQNILESIYLSGFDLKRKRADNYYIIQKISTG